MMKELIVGVDDSDGARTALAWAIEEARLRDEPLTAVHVMAQPTSLLAGVGLTPEEYRRIEHAALSRGEHLVDTLVSTAPESAAVVRRQTILGGPVARVLIDRAKDGSALVLGSRGRGGFARLLLGSVSEQVLHHAQCPVVVVPPDAVARSGRRARVVVGVDGSAGGMQALERAAHEARIRNTPLVVALVQEPPPAADEPLQGETALSSVLWTGLTSGASASVAEREERHQRMLAIWRSRGEAVLDKALGTLDDSQRPRDVERSVIADQHVARALLALADGAELLVVGARGLGGFAGVLLGSVSQQCVHHAKSPVMVVRSAVA